MKYEEIEMEDAQQVISSQDQVLRKVDDLIFGIRNLAIAADLAEVLPLVTLFDEIRISLDRPELSKIVKEAQVKISALTKAKNFTPATRLKDRICIMAAKAID